ncbi:hypothetical protein M0R45_020941 [Rubus argutus]|uniref:Uncharacterized protein n=1 Tax=Rubus argutus TaxID=59490 RepID=A0AAW1XDF2_RUBAR
MLSVFQSQKPGFRLPGANEPEARKPKYSPAPGIKAKEAKMAASPPHPDPGAVTCPRIVGGDPLVPGTESFEQMLAIHRLLHEGSKNSCA